MVKAGMTLADRHTAIRRMLAPCVAILAMASSPAAHAAAAAGASPQVMLQLGSYSSEAEAGTASARFKQTYAAVLGAATTEVQRADLGARGIWYRVLVGPFADRPAADATCGRLKSAGGSCLVAPVGTSSLQPIAATEGAASGASTLPPWIVAPPGAPPAAQPAPAPTPPSAPPAQAKAAPPPAETDFTRSLRLAEQGDPKAQLAVAGLYRNGRGVARDEAASLRWYRAAAEKGLAEAQFELAKAYDTAVGGPRDPFEAVRWYRLAAQQGFGRAQYNLGSMHGNGEGVPVDYVKAYMWFSISEATLAGGEREAARSAKVQASKLMMPDDLNRALQMAQRCLTSAYQNCD